MSERSVIELRAYLRKSAPPPDKEFNAFQERVGFIFKMRLEAERHFQANRHIAKSKLQTLPLCWGKIDEILHPDAASPPENLITQISREHLNETEAIIRDMRKILIREREKVSLGMVQQVDPHCLRWLSKQPGRNAIEKAGAQQRILAIVRREYFDTLENRVFKDFLMRAKHETALYLRRASKKFQAHETIKRVRRLGRLCAEGLHDPIIDEISSIRELPIPNYVLRQERRYSKIWKAYCELIRQADIAERLWLQREELRETLYRLTNEVKKHTNPRAKFHCPIWFNRLDGKRSLLDKPFYKNELIKGKTYIIPPVPERREKLPVPPSDVIVDLTGRQPSSDLLIYGGHENAKPYLQDYTRPSIEDINGLNHFFLRDLLVNPDVNDHSLRTKIRDYFEQLDSHIGGKRWFILVPDDWDALWLEIIIKSVPRSRNNIFLLWRSIAAVIGIITKLNNPHEDDTVAIIDIQQSGIVTMSKLTLAKGENGVDLIPQRKSYIRHKEYYDKRELRQNGPIPKRDTFLYGRSAGYIIPRADLIRLNTFVKRANHVVLIDNIGVEIQPPKWLVADGTLLDVGVRRFIAQRDEGKIAYYDELEALSLIVQTEEEQILAKPLVQANEKSPGGKEIVTKIIERAAVLKRESDYVDLILCMGEATPYAPLKIKRHEFARSLAEDHAIDLSARITPGQGMAVVTVMSDFLRDPIELDFLRGMTGKNQKNLPITITSLEDEMERSFPPDSPDVESDQSLWESVRLNVQAYMANQIPPDGTWFAKARNKFPQGVTLPKRASPLERLRRKNVFGNDPQNRYPRKIRRAWDTGEQRFDFEALFQKLADDYKRPADRNQIIRLIAWTYTSDEPAFDHIRQEAVKHVSDYAYNKTPAAPLFPEITLCANLCISPHEWLICLKAIEYRIKDYNNSVSRDFYLLYNLLQFHPTIIRDTGFYENDGCWKLARHISHWYHTYRNSSPTIGYILKSILYLLRCRRFDGKKFLTKEHDPEHYAIFDQCLNSTVNRSQEDLRRLVIKYLNNKGTIDGLPVD